MSIFREDGKEPDEVIAAARLVAGRWIYERVGHDKRRMVFCRDGSIGQGAAEMEALWDVRRIDGVLSVDIQSQESLTCRLTVGADGVWRGRWEEFEQMPVELRPVGGAMGSDPLDGIGADASREEVAAASRVMEAVDRLTSTRHLYRRMGHDARPMEFLCDGAIGAGNGRLEMQWRIHQRGSDVFLDIGNTRALTCRLMLGDGGVWRGRWETFERMPVEVYAHANAAPAIEEIDVVYTWVDGAVSAPLLRATLDAARGAVLPGAATYNRYRSIGELRFSLRSLHYYAPWVRRVFLVTNGDVPPWLNLDCPKLHVVTHGEIFERASDLPTFNSHAIEMNLHRIPGIGRAFLYFNDDLFLGQPVGLEDFVSADDVQSIFFTDWEIPRAKADQAHDRAYVSTLRLLDGAYGARPRRMLAHVPQLYRVDVLEEICGRWKGEFENTSANRFRTGDDAVLRILYAYYLLESPVPRWAARSVILPQGRDYVFVPISTNQAVTRFGLSRASQARPKFLCLNDEIAAEGESSAGFFEDVCEFLRGQYPWPSPFEREE